MDKMEEEDDAWSYSFPPSRESLPLRSPLQEPELSASKMYLLPADSPRSSTSLVEKLEGSSANETKLGSEASAKTGLSLILGMAPPPFVLKAIPANPHTTIEDAGSVLSKESTNALAVDIDASVATALSPPSTPVAKNDFSSSIRIWQEKQEEQVKLLRDSRELQSDELREELLDQRTGSSFMRSKFTSLTNLPIFAGPNESSENGNRDGPNSPKIITYRKKSHQRTQSDSYSIAMVTEERFDPKLYVEEKYSDTNYRYATIKRNVEFHQVFRSLDLTDRLLDDFACALSREILLQGRIYVTEHNVCFNSNLLGWVTSLVIPLAEIVRIDKKSTAGLFPNGISIETKTAKHNFASFISRDATFDFIRTVWLSCTGKSLSDLDTQVTESSINESIESQQRDSERSISNYILSIDEDDHGNGDEDEDIDEEEDEDDSEDYEDDSDDENDLKVPDSPDKTPTASGKSGSESGNSVKTFKPGSTYQNLGPDTHPPTEVEKVFPDSETEIEVCNEPIAAPLGVVFDILFGSTNTSFQRRFLETHDASEIDEYGSFHPVEGNESQLERSYTYRRALGYSIGPKSTKCLVREVVEQLDFSKSAVVLNTTSTPDVPSGGSFTVNTRYYFTWGPDSTTILRIAFFVKWTGRSWIKNVVEKLTLSAQATVTKDLLEELRKEISEHTQVVTGDNQLLVNEPSLTSNKLAVKLNKPKIKKKKVTAAGKNKTKLFSQDTGILMGIHLIVVMLGVLIWMQWKLARSITETKEVVNKEITMLSSLLGPLVLKYSKPAELQQESFDPRKEQASNLDSPVSRLIQAVAEEPLLMEAMRNLL